MHFVQKLYRGLVELLMIRTPDIGREAQVIKVLLQRLSLFCQGSETHIRIFFVDVFQSPEIE